MDWKTLFLYIAGIFSGLAGLIVLLKTLLSFFEDWKTPMADLEKRVTEVEGRLDLVSEGLSTINQSLVRYSKEVKTDLVYLAEKIDRHQEHIVEIILEMKDKEKDRDGD